MTHDHRTSDIHRADLDREIETIRTERLIATGSRSHHGLVERTRRAAGLVLISAGVTLAGHDATSLRRHGA